MNTSTLEKFIQVHKLSCASRRSEQASCSCGQAQAAAELRELQLKAETVIDVDKWNICPKPNHGGYEIAHGCRSCKLERVQSTIDAWRTAKQSKSLNWCADEIEDALSGEAVTE